MLSLNEDVWLDVAQSDRPLFTNLIMAQKDLKRVRHDMENYPQDYTVDQAQTVQGMLEHIKSKVSEQL